MILHTRQYLAHARMCSVARADSDRCSVVSVWTRGFGTRLTLEGLCARLGDTPPGGFLARGGDGGEACVVFARSEGLLAALHTPGDSKKLFVAWHGERMPCPCATTTTNGERRAANDDAALEGRARLGF